MSGSMWRRAGIAMITAVLLVLLPGMARAEPPANDDFDSSMTVPALPFTVRLDTGEATGATDDPSECETFHIGGTVWFSFTATENVVLRATAAGSDHWTILSAFTGARGGLREVPGACDFGSNFPANVTFPASAGTTYHFMVAGYDVPGGDLSFGLDVAVPAPNDNFAGAEPVSTLPSTRVAQLWTASTEFDEPTSRCVDGVPDRSVWYAFSPAETVSVVAELEEFNGAVTVYTGGSLPDLREVGCARGSQDVVLFRALAGATYFVGVTGPSFVDRLTLSLTEAPALTPIFSVSGATIYEETIFDIFFHDPLDAPIVGGQWNFGDGTTAPVTGTSSVRHHYTSDGTYQATLTIQTEDGRTGTRTSPVTVQTHDVGIDRFSVPARARVGDTKPIAVDVSNTRYPESVTVELHKSGGSPRGLIGTLTLDVPASPDGTVKFPFAYTFTPEDAIAGKVTFRAVVKLPFDVRDARPADNEVIAIATTVRPSLLELRFA